MAETQKLDNKTAFAQHGLFVKGIVSQKNVYPATQQRQEGYSVDVFCRGCKQLLTIGCTKAQMDAATEGEIAQYRVTFEMYNGKSYFKLAD